MSTDDCAETQWNGSAAAVIESETDPWIRDAAGNDVDLAALIKSGVLVEREDRCGDWTIHPGVFAPVNTDYGVEMCDECDRFTCDLSATRALADALGTGYTVWFHGTN